MYVHMYHSEQTFQQIRSSIYEYIISGHTGQAAAVPLTRGALCMLIGF
jgi:DNA-binding transcriptional regulator YhcF (GntR family)